jgi:hypothetical protein
LDVGSRLVLAITALLILSPSFAFAQSVSPEPPATVGLGFGPLSIEPVNLGIPVYAPGDQLWVQSFENKSGTFLTLAPPSGNPGSSVLLAAGGLIRLHTFADSDPSGVWTLWVESLGSGTTIVLNVTLAAAPPQLLPNFVRGNLSGNELKLTYGIPPTPAYNIQECTMGTAGGSSTSFRLPTSIGGTLSVDLSGGEATVATSGALTTFTGWLEVHTSRAFANGEALVSEETMAARTPGVFDLNGTSLGQVVQLSPEMSLRPGRYDLRAFVSGPSGLASYDAPYLRTNSSGWIALSGCTQLSSVGSSSFVMSDSLDDSNSTWPRSLYTMYTVGGVDSFTVSGVPTMEARIDVRNTETLANLAGVELQATGEGVQSWGTLGGGVYVIGTSFPLRVSVGATFRGVVSESYNVTISDSFSHVQLGVEAGTLTVRTSDGGLPLANVPVDVSAKSPGGASFMTDGHGNLTLTLPPGVYNVTASYAGKTASNEGDVQAGADALLSIDFGTHSSPYAVYALFVVLAVGLGINVAVWRAYVKRRSS